MNTRCNVLALLTFADTWMCSVLNPLTETAVNMMERNIHHQLVENDIFFYTCWAHSTSHPEPFGAWQKVWVNCMKEYFHDDYLLAETIQNPHVLHNNNNIVMRGLSKCWRHKCCFWTRPQFGGMQLGGGGPTVAAYGGHTDSNIKDRGHRHKAFVTLKSHFCSQCH